MGSLKAYKTYKFSRIDMSTSPEDRDNRTMFDVVNYELYFTTFGLSLKASNGHGGVADLTDGLYVLGDAFIQDELFILVTDGAGNDSIRQVTETANDQDGVIVSTLVTADFGFSKNHPIKAFGNVSGNGTKKIYFIDGLNQFRHFNITNPTLDIDVCLGNNTSGSIDVGSISGTSSVNASVRYAYSMYNIEGSSSKLSGFTNLVNISKDTNTIAELVVVGTDKYSNVRIYRLSYAGASVPTADLILDQAFNQNRTVNFVDDGSISIAPVSLEELTDIGSEFIIPQTLNVKKNHAVLGNYKRSSFVMNEGLVRTSGMKALYLTGGAYLNLGKVPLIDSLKSKITLKIQIDSWGVNENPFGYDEGLLEQFTATRDASNHIVAGLQIPSGGSSTGNTIPTQNNFYIFEIENAGSGFITMTINGKSVFQQNGFDLLTESISDFYIGGFNNAGNLAGSMTCRFIEGIFINSTTTKIFNEDNDWGGLVNNGGVIQYSGDSGATWSATIPTDVEPVKKAGYWDARIYGLEIGSTDVVVENIENVQTTFSSYSEVPLAHDCINPDWTTYNQIEGGTGTSYGMEGDNIKLTLYPVTVVAAGNAKRLKQGENYRLLIKLQDEYFRWSQALWMCDILVPYLSDTIDAVVELKNIPDESVHGKVLNYQILMVERTDAEKTIKCQGIPQPIMSQVARAFGDATYGTDILKYSPYPNMKGLVQNPSTAGSLMPFEIHREFNKNGVVLDPDFDQYQDGSVTRDYMYRSGTSDDIYIPGTTPESSYLIQSIDNRYQLLITPETALNPYDLSVTGLNIVGSRTLITNTSNIKVTNDNDGTGSISWDDTIDATGTGATARPVTRWDEYYGSTAARWQPEALFDFFKFAHPHENNIRVSYGYQRSAVGSLEYAGTDPYERATQVEKPIDRFKYSHFEDTTVIDSIVLSNSPELHPFVQGGATGDEKTSYKGEGCPKYFMHIDAYGWAGTIVDDPDWPAAAPLKPSINTYDNFPGPTNNYHATLPIVDIKNNLTNQYGGNSFEAKQASIGIDASDPTNVSNGVLISGDTYCGTYNIPFNTGANKTLIATYSAMYDYVSVVLESSVAPTEYNVDLKPILTSKDFSNALPLSNEFLTTYDKTFSTTPSFWLTAGLPFNFVSIEDYTTRITVSDQKVLGENIDSWTQIQTGTNLDLLGIYGELTGLIKQGDNIIAFQERAIAFIKMYPTNQVQGSTGAIQLGKGAVLDDYEYLKTNTGALSHFSIKEVNGSIYYIDAYNNTLNELSEGDISTLSGLNILVDGKISKSTDVELMPQVFVDMGDKKLIGFKLNNTDPVIMFNYATKTFTHRRTFNKSHWFCYFLNNLYLGNFETTGKIYKADKGLPQGYGAETYASWVELWCNPLLGRDKVFDSITAYQQGGSFGRIKVVGYDRESAESTVDIAEKFSEHNIHLPRVLQDRNPGEVRGRERDRWRVPHIRIKLIFEEAVEHIVSALRVHITMKK